MAGSDFHEGDEAATIELTLINHGRRQPRVTNARNADCVHNPGIIHRQSTEVFANLRSTPKLPHAGSIASSGGTLFTSNRCSQSGMTDTTQQARLPARGSFSSRIQRGRAILSTVNKFMKNFADYIENTGRPDESAVLSEFFSGPLTKTAVIALVMKVSSYGNESNRTQKLTPRKNHSPRCWCCWRRCFLSIFAPGVIHRTMRRVHFRGDYLGLATASLSFFAPAPGLLPVSERTPGR